MARFLPNARERYAFRESLVRRKHETRKNKFPIQFRFQAQPVVAQPEVSSVYAQHINGLLYIYINCA